MGMVRKCRLYTSLKLYIGIKMYIGSNTFFSLSTTGSPPPVLNDQLNSCV